MSRLPLGIALCFSLLAAPAFADDNGAAPATTQPVPTSQGAPKKTSGRNMFALPKSVSSGAWVKDAGNVSVRVASTAAGTTLGMPMAAAHIFGACEVEHSKAMPLIGDKSNKALVLLSRTLAVPTATFVTIFGTPYYTSINSWRASGDKPFSKDALGFGKFDDSICAP